MVNFIDLGIGTGWVYIEITQKQKKYIRIRNTTFTTSLFFRQLCDECYIYAHADTTQAEKPTANVVVFSHGGLLSSLVSR